MKNITYALRVLLRNKFYAFLNIFGLAIGLAVSIIIMLYVQSDYSFDKSHEQWDQLYRIESKYFIPPKNDEFALTPTTLAELMQEEFPEILSFTRFQNTGQILFRIEDKNFYVDDVYLSDSSTFSMFTHKFLQGDPKTALTEPNSLVLTESTAKRLFGNQDALSQIVKTDGNTFNVTGVIEDVPTNVHLRFNALISMTTATSGQPVLTSQQKANQLWNIALYSYIKLPKGYDINNIYKKFPDFYEKYMSPITAQVPSLREASFSPRLVPLNEVHFNSRVQFDLPTGNKAYTNAFMAIGLFVLILASINYMNLATARATKRSKEVGIKKVLGSTRKKLVSQFLSESILITIISLLVAILFVNLLIYGTDLNGLLDKELTLDFMNNNLLLFGSLGTAILLGILSGLYPAFYLSTISVLVAMKGSVKSGPGSLFLRKVLVAFQFFVSIGVVISTLLMSNQISFMRQKDIGFNKDNVIIVPTRDTLVSSRLKVIQNELRQNPNIVDVTTATGMNITTSNSVGNRLIGGGRQLMMVETVDTLMKTDTYNVMFTGENYVNAMQMEIKEGRDFDENIPTDLTNGALVNEALVEAMGWDDAIGKKIQNAGPNSPVLRVLGVLRDFHAYSLHVKVEPTILFRYERFGPVAQTRPSVVVHAKAGKLQQTLDFLENKYAEVDPSHPFEFGLLDNQAEMLYRSDKKQSTLTAVLSYICILISCLGLLGLSSYTTATRIKEIGVRKVLGATVPQLVFMVFRDIMILVLVGFAIAAPVAYLLIEDWLQVFQYTMNLPTVIIGAAGVAGILALVIAFLTVSFHSLKAANQNPVKALRYE
ncbi:ABC transporter permease [Roseivirga sp.]|uniref:ABC transporter permease n=1 Tax=Roseivirga sp. TaxID=1964215 RepID=UPI003B8C4D22